MVGVVEKLKVSNTVMARTRTIAITCLIERRTSSSKYITSFRTTSVALNDTQY